MSISNTPRHKRRTPGKTFFRSIFLDGSFIFTFCPFPLPSFRLIILSKRAGEVNQSPPVSFLKKPCVVVQMEERGSPAEGGGQDSPGTNPFDSAKKGNRKKRARSQARSKERPLPGSAKIAALPSGPGKDLRSSTGGDTSLAKRQRFFHGLELHFCRFRDETRVSRDCDPASGGTGSRSYKAMITIYPLFSFNLLCYIYPKGDL